MFNGRMYNDHDASLGISSILSIISHIICSIMLYSLTASGIPDNGLPSAFIMTRLGTQATVCPG